MADSESNLLAYLIAQTGVKSSFGSSNTRIYIDRVDPSITVSYPFAVIRTVKEVMDYAHDGDLKDRTLFQIDVYSTAKSTANSGADALKAALSGYRGAMSSMTAGSSFVVNVRGGFDPASQMFYRSLDVQIGQNG